METPLISEHANPNILFAPLQKRLQATLPMAQIKLAPLPNLPDLRLGLIDADFPTTPLAPEVMHAVLADPAYWAFCWGSGLATAQWLFEHPEIVRDKRVGDIGSGSGVVSVAAKLAGASQVWACDNHADALCATELNAAANKVHLELVDNLNQLPGDLDIIFMADVLYDRSNFSLINAAKPLCSKLIIADSRVTDVEDPAFELTHQKLALTYPNLGEFDEFKTVNFFCHQSLT